MAFLRQLLDKIHDIDTMAATRPDSSNHFQSSFQKILTNLTPNNPTLTSNQKKQVVMLPFDQLIVEKEIGEGGFAKVWQGKYNNQSVAIKVSNDIDDGSFLSEAIIMSELNPSPYIVTCIGYSVSNNDNSPCIVMELMQESLDTYLKNTNLDWNTCIQIATEVAAGLQHMHQNDYVHSDIKSGNILLGPIQVLSSMDCQ